MVDRANGVGRLARALRHRPRRARVRDASCRSCRSTGRRQRNGSGGDPPRLRTCRRNADVEHQGRPSHLRGRGDPRHDLHRRHRDHGADRRVGMQPSRHVLGMADEPAATGADRWSNGGGPSPTTTGTSRRSMRSSIASRCRHRRRPAWRHDGGGSVARRDPSRSFVDGTWSGARAAGDVHQLAVGARRDAGTGRSSRVQPGGAVHPVRPRRRLGGQPRAAALARPGQQQCWRRASSIHSSSGER